MLTTHSKELYLPQHGMEYIKEKNQELQIEAYITMKGTLGNLNVNMCEHFNQQTLDLNCTWANCRLQNNDAVKNDASCGVSGYNQLYT